MTAPDAAPGAAMRERRRQRVSREIERIALGLFAERGFDDVTVDEIAAEADIHPRTFFRYFASKEDVLTGDPRGWVDDMHNAFLARAEEPVGVALRAAAVAAAGAYDDDRETVLLRAKIAEKDREVFARARNYPTAAQESFVSAVASRLGEPAAGIRTRLLAYTVIGTFHLALGGWIESGAKDSLPTRVDEAFRVIGEVLFTP